MNRRDFLLASVALPLAASAAGGFIGLASAQPAPFDRAVVRQLARDAAGKAFKAPDSKLPDNLKDLDYDHYRAIRFLPDRALWRGDKLPFEVQFFHRGSFYTNRVDIYEVAERPGDQGRLSTRELSRSATRRRRSQARDLGFAGFRLHAPMNKPDYYDEVCVFLGASYFRAVAKGELYGLSARGLSINTGEAKGEEFPPSRRSGSRSRPRTPPRSSCMRCSTARAPRRPIASRSGPATPPCSTWRWRSIRGSTSNMPASRR